MNVESVLMITPSPVASATIWLLVMVTVLFLARSSAHAVIGGLGRVLRNAMRLGARSVNQAEQRLAARNRAVLLAAGQEAKERIIEREFDRVGDSVSKDLAGYPGLSRNLSDAITRIEEDHQGAVEVPPDPPGWVKAVDAVAKIEPRNDSVTGSILAEIHKSLVRAQDKAIAQYREASRERHMLLKRMMPEWRKIQQTLGTVNKNVESVLARSRSIDRHMDEYEEIVRGTDRAVQTLSSSSLVQFFVSMLVLAVAVGGATINFSLIARPMSEMVGGTSFIGNFRTSDIAALVIIMVEISMGLFLMESTRITRLFPVIGALPDKLRVRMIYITFTILLILASVEAGLAYMRELLMHDELATSAILRGDAVTVQNEFLWITTAAQMGMGFILPFALVFVAIPLETFVHSLRTVLGLAGIGALRSLALVMRVTGNAFQTGANMLMRLYDMVIFLPLFIEHITRARAGDGRGGARKLGEV